MALWAHLLPAFTRGVAQIGIWEVVSSYSSATVPGFHGIPSIDSQLDELAKISPEDLFRQKEGQGFLA